MEIESEDSRFISEELKWCIVIAKIHFGLTYRDIQHQFGIGSLGTISKVLQKYEYFYSVDNNYENCGVHNSQDHCEEIKEGIQLIQLTKYSTLDVQNQIKSAFNITISRSQIQRSLYKLNMKYGRIREVHLLTEDNKLSRLEYCKKMQNNNLKSLIFSDESIFSLSECNASCWISNDESNTFPTKQLQYQDRQIHIWGAVSYYSKSKLFIHSKSVNSEQYMSCLKEVFLPFISKDFQKKSNSLLQDGARAHVSKVTKQFFEENNISITQNPPWSPDLNAIEFIWAYMKKIFIKIRLNTQIKKREQLIEVVSKIWEEIPQDVIQNIINHTKQKMKDVIQSNGSYVE